MVTVTNITRHDGGSMICVTADLASVGNTDTWQVPHLQKIFHASVTPTTDDSISLTVSGATITFVDGASLAGSIAVWGY